MELLRGLHNIANRQDGCVLTIGKFDGVHKGHQVVLKRLREKARELALPCAVMIFEPQPEEVFTPQNAPARLSTFRDKFELMSRQGIDQLICIRFNPQFASHSPEAFIHDLLVERLGVKFLVVGDDFKFGRKRAGDFDMLKKAGERESFDVVNTASFRLDNCRISSTEIRNALFKGDFERAEHMLGRPYTMQGKIVHGEKKGRTIGFPTANVLLSRCRSPLHGVFAVIATLGNKTYKGVANIGNRPTLDGERMQLEVHLFNFDRQVYGSHIAVTPVKKIRDEVKFGSFEQLKNQITKDAQQANEVLSNFYSEGRK